MIVNEDVKFEMARRRAQRKADPAMRDMLMSLWSAEELEKFAMAHWTNKSGADNG